MNSIQTSLKSRHLTEDEFLRTLVDKRDLSNTQSDHLKECTICRQALDRIEHRFRDMGQMAVQMTPKPSRPFRLPDRSSHAARWRFRPVWVTGLTAVLIALLITFWPRGSDQPSLSPVPVPQTDLSDLELMQDIDALVENALPSNIRQLASVATPQFDEDLINWIVPSIQEDEHRL
jgi:hypothetical protein